MEQPTTLTQNIKRTFKGIVFTYNEVYYLGYSVNEGTGCIDKEKKVPYYTKEQATINLKNIKAAYTRAKVA